MTSNQKNPFPYYVGVQSLHEMANKHSRVCVMNILGGESSTVTPISHSYSGGNVVAGVQYGRTGELETEDGSIPVYGSITEVLSAGHEFDTGVIYLPPAAVNHAVSELCAHNDALEKIIILTEKISVADARMIRYGCQQRRVDVFGANCLGIANPWDRVRVGGALGGDNPAESLKKGSIAIYSNSGNFCTTISEYLKTAGFGVSTVLSSGKDVYIHFALAEFLYCAENDPRTKAIVAYIEPGGYYEKQALDWIEENRFRFSKPIVVCVTGRWKSNLSRACGHAGAVGGTGDDALAKEKWFDDYFGVGLFDPEVKDVSERGVRIKSIQDVPLAVKAVMEKVGETVDFPAVGDLSLKPWFVNDQGITFPESVKAVPVKAQEPYCEQIELVSRQIGGQLPRENMRNKSGASQMNRKTHVTEVHGVSLLDLVEHPFGGTCLFAVTKEMPKKEAMPLVNVVLNAFVHRGTAYTDAAQVARKNGATPNAFIACEVLIAGDKPFAGIRQAIVGMIDSFYVDIKTNASPNKKLVDAALKKKGLMPESKGTELESLAANEILKVAKEAGMQSIFTDYAAAASEGNKKINALDTALAAALLTLVWGPVTNRRITRNAVEELGTFLALNGIIVANAPSEPLQNKRWKSLAELKDVSVLREDFTTSCFEVLFNRSGEDKELFAMNSLFNLTVSNGPGTLSGKGAKESISAKNHISTAFAGFMTNTGIAHGGNGFEAVAFLMEQFDGFDPYEVSGKKLDSKLKALANKTAVEYASFKKKAKTEGNMNYMKIPCVNHPVFKDKPVNIDPREEYIFELFEKKKMTNPFQVYYHELVKELFEVGATRNVFCVNIDAVIATISLELFWKQLKKGEITKEKMQDIVFIMFLFGRMTGTAAEISDHLARGTDMDCRTPASEVSFVS